MHVLWMPGVGAATTIAVYVLWLCDPAALQENGLVENTQVVFLLLAATVHGLRSRTVDIAERCMRLGLALLSVSLVAREVDIDRLGDEAIMSSVETILRGTLVVVWVIWGWRSRKALETLWSHRLQVAFGRVGLLVLAGGALYGASWPFDKYPRQLGGEEAILVEEMLQLLATMTLFAASLAPRVPALRTASSRATDPRSLAAIGDGAATLRAAGPRGSGAGGAAWHRRGRRRANESGDGPPNP